MICQICRQDFDRYRTIQLGMSSAPNFRHAPTPSTSPPPRLTFTRYLVIWETEGTNAQRLQDARIAAVKAGQIRPPAIDVATAQSSWWVTTSPFIDKDDFER